MPARTARDQLGGPAQLLGRVDVVAGAGLDPADVDDRRALGHRPVDRGQRGRRARTSRRGRRTSPGCG